MSKTVRKLNHLLRACQCAPGSLIGIQKTHRNFVLKQVVSFREVTDKDIFARVWLCCKIFVAELSPWIKKLPELGV